MPSWAAIFFTLWWINVIIALFKQNFTVSFNFIFQMAVVGTFLGDDGIPVNFGSVLTAISVCWLALILSCIPRAVRRARYCARLTDKLNGSDSIPVRPALTPRQHRANSSAE
jgi:hypothetical protein